MRTSFGRSRVPSCCLPIRRFAWCSLVLFADTTTNVRPSCCLPIRRRRTFAPRVVLPIRRRRTFACSLVLFADTTTTYVRVFPRVVCRFDDNVGVRVSCCLPIRRRRWHWRVPLFADTTTYVQQNSVDADFPSFRAFACSLVLFADTTTTFVQDADGAGVQTTHADGATTAQRSVRQPL